MVLLRASLCFLRHLSLFLTTVVKFHLTDLNGWENLIIRDLHDFNHGTEILVVIVVVSRIFFKFDLIFDFIWVVVLKCFIVALIFLLFLLFFFFFQGEIVHELINN